ncbi:MAG: co-chaperone YbbN, partial [Propionibacteriaceae bacterium]|nr:co-chaperone YbbN [Propionibacteriaceae bacterium]
MAINSGAMDLSGLAPTTVTSGAYVTEVTEATFDSMIRKSIQYPVVVEFYSSKAPESQGMGEVLSGLANSANGAWLLGRMNVDNSPQVVQALQIRAVPMVIALLGGQLVPLWQGSMPKDDIEKVIAELLKMAAGSGILGRAEPQISSDDADEPVEDPRYTPAFDAMGEGDYVKAGAEFEKLLAQTPADPVAKAGRAQAGLLARVQTLDAEATLAAVANPEPSLEAILAASDLDVALGKAASGFARLIQAIAATKGEDRE